MLVARVYTVLDATLVELSCVHPGDPEKNHLLVREQRTGRQPGLRAMIAALADGAELAGRLVELEGACMGQGEACDTA